MQRYFFRDLLGFLHDLAGFQSNIKEIKQKIPSKLHVFAGKTSTFVSADTTKRREQNCQCGKQIRITGNLFW